MKTFFLFSKSSAFVFTLTILLSIKSEAQLSQNANKLTGISVTGTTSGSNSSDWIYGVTTLTYGLGFSTIATGYVETSSSKNPICVLTQTSGLTFEEKYPIDHGRGFEVIETPNGIFIFGEGDYVSGATVIRSLFSAKINPATGTLDATYGSGGIKFYNELNTGIPAGQNGLAHTHVGSVSSNKLGSRAIINQQNFALVGPHILQGFILCGNYCDDSYPNNASSATYFGNSANLTTGCFLLKLDANGDPDPNFGTNGVVTYYSNSSGDYKGPHVFDVCVDYDSNGDFQGYTAVGSINENPSILQAHGDFNNDAFFFRTDTDGVIICETVYDETTYMKTSGSPYSISYTDNSDNSFCSNWATPIRPVIALTQENTNERAVRVKQAGDGNGFIVANQFDFTFWFHDLASPCSLTYPSTGFFVAADPAIFYIDQSCAPVWTQNTYQCSGVDFGNDILYDKTGDVVMVLGSTMQEPLGTPVYQQPIVSQLNVSNGTINYEYVYDDTSASSPPQSMFCPFSFDFYGGKGIIIGGDNDLGNDDYEFIWIWTF